MEEEKTLTVTRTELIRAFTKWNAAVAKTANGTEYVDRKVNTPDDLVDELITHLTT